MDSAAIIQLRNFKSNDDDVVLLVSNEGATNWLADGSCCLARRVAGKEAMVIGNGTPIISPENIEIRFAIIESGSRSRLIECEPNKLFWRRTAETVWSCSEKCRNLRTAPERTEFDGGCSIARSP